MSWDLRVLTVGGVLLFGSSLGEPAYGQQSGGVLRIYHWDSPACRSMRRQRLDCRADDGGLHAQLAKIFG
jgi:hypothetical protein